MLALPEPEPMQSGTRGREKKQESKTLQSYLPLKDWVNLKVTEWNQKWLNYPRLELEAHVQDVIFLSTNIVMIIFKALQTLSNQ